MNARQKGKAAIVIVCLLVMVAIIAAVVLLKKQLAKTVVSTQPTTVPTTAPATKPSTRPAPPPPPTDLLSVVRANDPHYPTTQELDIPGTYEQAAHVVLDQPVYLCPAGHVRITDSRAKPIEEIITKLGDGNSHAVKDEVLFVHWQTTDMGRWIP